MKYFIGDLHLFDEGIIRIAERPFKNANEMTKAFITNWNSVVKDEDEVFVDGDLVFGNVDIDRLKDFLSELKGTKYLIRGNHDLLNNNAYRKIGFKEVYDYPIVLNGFWIVSHEPLYVTENAPYFNIYAHIHNNPNYKTCSTRGYCVSAERINYTPISFERIMNEVYNL